MLGDNGKLYTNFDKEMIIEMRHLITQADVITPNLTELFYLLDKPYKAENSDEELKAYLHELRTKVLKPSSLPAFRYKVTHERLQYTPITVRATAIGSNLPYLPAHYPVQEIHLQASLPVL